MPHLSYDHAAALGDFVDMGAFADHMRRAMLETGLFPIGGIRVRGHAASSESVADGVAGRLWLDMQLRIGQGRSDAEKSRATQALYAAARTFLEPRIGTRPFALSLELREIDPAFSAKSWNTVHQALKG